MQNQKTVVVIGAGPAGILACKYLKGHVNIICFEGRESFGGQWLKEEPLTKQQQQNNAYYQYYSTHFSSLYKGLQTNLPYQTMVFKGHPHQKNQSSHFLTAQEFQEYISSYVDHHDLKKYMKFNTFVQKVGRIENLDEKTKAQLKINNNEKFYIQVCESQNYKKTSYYVADYVMVCNGHNISPHNPDFQNKDTFQGKIFHTHDLLDGDDKEFQGKKVVVQGARSSSFDQVDFILSKNPKEVYWIGFSDRDIKFCQHPESDFTEQVKSGLLKPKAERIIKVQENSKNLVLSKDTIIQDVDVIVQATGYKYTYPFLNSNVNEFFETKEDQFIDYPNDIDNKNEINYKFFGPLYKRIFSVNEPDLMFIGLMERVAGLQQLIERMAIAATQYIIGQVQLPSKEEMLLEWEKDVEHIKRVNPKMKTLFQIGNPSEKEYAQDLAKFCNIPFDEQFQEQSGQCGQYRAQYQKKGKFVSFKEGQFQNNYLAQEGLF